ncbi:uncharacterized protein TrAFT101_009869 [Trichoderma asperellum]|uniref:uncharacterized protein n=1 Tax=Trichoderma asperellum TaxID=101201 RepID=UPI00331F8EEE|nr:hypothetical protein TrAFT101_009869 [Trichoderma asperellum]
MLMLDVRLGRVVSKSNPAARNERPRQASICCGQGRRLKLNKQPPPGAYVLRNVKPGTGMVMAKERRTALPRNATMLQSSNPSIMLLEPSFASPPPPAVGSAGFPCHTARQRNAGEGIRGLGWRGSRTSAAARKRKHTLEGCMSTGTAAVLLVYGLQITGERWAAYLSREH